MSLSQTMSISKYFCSLSSSVLKSKEVGINFYNMKGIFDRNLAFLDNANNVNISVNLCIITTISS